MRTTATRADLSHPLPIPTRSGQALVGVVTVSVIAGASAWAMSHGHPSLFDVAGVLQSVCAAPFSSAQLWVYGLLGSTLVPTFVHFAVASVSVYAPLAVASMGAGCLALVSVAYVLCAAFGDTLGLGVLHGVQTVGGWFDPAVAALPQCTVHTLSAGGYK